MTPTPGTPADTFRSPNFQFLAVHHQLLVRTAAQAERYLFEDPSTSLNILRRFAELLADQACAYLGLATRPEDDFARVLGQLRDSRNVPRDVLDRFHDIRRAGNAAVHEGRGTQGDALHHLRMARELAIWFHRSFGNASNFSPGPFLPPPNPAQASLELQQELDRLRQQALEQQQQVEQVRLTATQEAELRRQAEERAQTAYADLNAALSLAEETEVRLAQEREQFLQRIAQLQAEVAARPAEQIQEVAERARRAATFMELDEPATRRIIDQQLRDAGWEADSEILTHRNGARPRKGCNRAIAEWPVSGGVADYVLFVGLTPVATVEAKRANRNVPAAVDQARRYARAYTPDGTEEMPGGPWGEYRIPFCLATNGRPYLRQLEDSSGIWFVDARRPTNLPRALEGWYTPDGFLQLLQQNTAVADSRLQQESPEYLPLREYQFQAIRAVEAGLAEGRRQMLLAMATGTGKTRTCIGLIYRLIKAGRFHRVLFLVDRTALGEQAADALKNVRLENLQTFTEIYDVKELGDITPDSTTRLHIATIQGMVRRLLLSECDTAFPVDTYDCIVVDECHRGYSLDRELNEDELTFRDEADYISKYRRVLDHFDAVKIGLTATPALHTVEIFGEPIYTYGYRQAVIDGYLVDHEPPLRIITKLAEDGITWAKDSVIQTYIPHSAAIDPITTPDEVQIDLDDFNRRVITENFNRVVCAELARQIDPGLEGKTIIFCVGDPHADQVVRILKKAFEEQYGSVENDAVVKITGTADNPLQLIRRFKNERLPRVAVTVDLLTTGVDIPEVTNLVFLRRVRSRILYEQMLGRATRLCPEIGKQSFRVFDAVELYEALEPHSAMKPVVVNPQITFRQLAQELTEATTDAVRGTCRDQFVAKLQRKRQHLRDAHAEYIETLTGLEPTALIAQIRSMTPEQLRDFLTPRPQLVAFLDRAGDPDPRRILISDHADELRRLEHGYGPAATPQEHLNAFCRFVAENREHIPALRVAIERPCDLTRQQFRELRLALDEAGFTEVSLQTATREVTHQDIAATLLGHVQHIINGQPLLPYRDRVQSALRQVLASQNWTPPQRRWLERIARQFEVETILDRAAFDQGQFREEGGFERLNRIFNGHLEQILAEITNAVWNVAGL